ncbi:hypothetical protein [Mycolicibacterium sp. CR10]|uniref:hypothetical protein n=1 Tax=Mycolicibacterium sp. CR10 TaxID=2562314 RepID=UPI0010C0CD96|nr:hypothetical protein [Mycolicibacterium sp. CR10]
MPRLQGFGPVLASCQIARSDPAREEIEAPTEYLDPPVEDDDAPSDDGAPTKTAENAANSGGDADEVERESSAEQLPILAEPEPEPEPEPEAKDGPDEGREQRTDAGPDGASESPDQPTDPA